MQAYYFFANNVGLYINSQQTIHRLRPITLDWTSIAISHRSARPVSRNKVTPSEKSPSVETVTRTANVVHYHQHKHVPPSRLYYVVTKAYLLLGGYRTTIKLSSADLFHYEICPGETLFVAPACLAAMEEYGMICTWRVLHFCKFVANHNIDLELDFYLQKDNKM